MGFTQRRKGGWRCGTDGFNLRRVAPCSDTGLGFLRLLLVRDRGNKRAKPRIQCGATGY